MSQSHSPSFRNLSGTPPWLAVFAIVAALGANCGCTNSHASASANHATTSPKPLPGQSLPHQTQGPQSAKPPRQSQPRVLRDFAARRSPATSKPWRLSVRLTRRVKAFRRTSTKPSPGSPSPPKQATVPPWSASAECMRLAQEWKRITRKLSAGIRRPQPTEIPKPCTTSVAPTKPAPASGKMSSRP